MRLNRSVLACAAILGLAAAANARVEVNENLTANTARTALAPASAGDSGGGGGVSGFDTKEGGFYWKSDDGNNKLVVGGLLQGQFFGQAVSGDNNNTATFRVRRARLSFSGNLYRENFKYYTQIGSDFGADFELLDGWVKYVHSDEFAFKVGQFKTPINRQFMTHGGKQQFVKRSNASQFFIDNVAERDLGVEASGGFGDNKFQWAGALVNGNGRNSDNGDRKFQYLGRAVFNIAGDYGYSEGDVDGTQDAAAVIGGSLSYHDLAGDSAQTALNIDGGYKNHGLSLQGEFYWNQDTDVAATDFTTSAAYIQGGYFFRPGQSEVVGRWSRVSPEGDDNDSSEYTFGYNHYWFAHRLKAQVDYNYVDLQFFEDGVHEFYAQLQLMF